MYITTNGCAAGPDWLEARKLRFGGRCLNSLVMRPPLVCQSQRQQQLKFTPAQLFGHHNTHYAAASFLATQCNKTLQTTQLSTTQRVFLCYLHETASILKGNQYGKVEKLIQ